MGRFFLPHWGTSVTNKEIMVKVTNIMNKHNQGYYSFIETFFQLMELIDEDTVANVMQYLNNYFLEYAKKWCREKHRLAEHYFGMTKEAYDAAVEKTLRKKELVEKYIHVNY